MGGLLTQGGGRTILKLVTQSITLGRRTRGVRVISGFLRVCESFCELLHGFIALGSFCAGSHSIATVFRSKELVISRERYHFYVPITSVNGRGAVTTNDKVFLVCYSYDAGTGPNGLSVITTVAINSVKSVFIKGGIVCCSGTKIR